jgi:hypothetical protein
LPSATKAARRFVTWGAEMSRFYTGLLTRESTGYLTQVVAGAPVAYDFTNIVVFDTASSLLGDQADAVILMGQFSAEFVTIEKRYNQVRGVSEALIMLRAMVPMNGGSAEVNAYTRIQDEPNRSLRSSKFLTQVSNALHIDGLKLTFSLFSINEGQFRGLIEDGSISLDAFYSDKDTR